MNYVQFPTRMQYLCRTRVVVSMFQTSIHEARVM